MCAAELRRSVLPAAVLLASIASVEFLRAEDVRVRDSVALRDALARAKPGTRVLLEPGTFEGGITVTSLRGRPDSPIIVAAADPDRPPLIRGGGTGMQLSDPEHVELRDLVLEGAASNGLNIDDGGSFDSPARGIVLRNLVVRDAGGSGNNDGIKLSGLDGFLVERCTVERWGRGGSAIDMVGCHQGRIEGCTFRDRESRAAATGVQAKGGSSEIVVRRCRFEHAGERAVNIGGSTGLAYFRPAPRGYEAKDITVEGCTFIGSDSPVAFVGADGATVRYNTFYRPRRWILRILQETREPGFVPCRDGIFERNLVVFRRDDLRAAVNVGSATAPETFLFARNYWFCEDDPPRSRPDLPVKEEDGTGGQDPLLADPARGDLTPALEGPAKGYGASALSGPTGSGAAAGAAHR